MTHWQEGVSTWALAHGGIVLQAQLRYLALVHAVRESNGLIAVGAQLSDKRIA